MKRVLTLTLLLATMLAAAACAASDTGRSESVAPTEPQRTQADSAQRKGEQESTPKDEPFGFRVTTIEGEEVRLGGQGDVTALFFMAGW